MEQRYRKLLRGEPKDEVPKETRRAAVLF